MKKAGSVEIKKILKKIRLWERPISIVLGVAVIAVAGVLIFNFFKSRGQGKLAEEKLPVAQETMTGENQEQAAKKLPTTHTVSAGENLWLIAENYYGSGYNWVDIALANKIINADSLAIGQKLIIPVAAVRQPIQKTASLAVNEQKTAQIDRYSVVKGDSLWKIAYAVYGDGFQWVKIFQANKAKIGANPNLIFTGTVLVIP